MAGQCISSVGNGFATDRSVPLAGADKVETIGDAYMCVSNLFEAQPDHAARIARFAIAAVKAANQVVINDNDPSKFIDIRYGLELSRGMEGMGGDGRPADPQSPCGMAIFQCRVPYWPRGEQRCWNQNPALLPLWLHCERGIEVGSYLGRPVRSRSFGL